MKPFTRDEIEAQAKYSELEHQRDHLRGVVQAHDKAEPFLTDQVTSANTVRATLREISDAVAKLPPGLQGSVAVLGGAGTSQTIPDVRAFANSLIAGTFDVIIRRQANASENLTIVVDRLASARDALARIEAEIAAMEAAS